MSALLSIEHIGVSYGHIEAVRDVSLTIEPGQIVTIIGPNGAGKTSLMLATMGLLPSCGRIRFDGRDLDDVEVEDRVERGMCLVPERRELFHDMSVLDNLVLGSYNRRDRASKRRDLDEVFERFPALSPRRQQLAGTLSGGERQMLALARALLAKPRLLLLDEPSLGLAPLIVRDVLRTIASLRTLGISILLVEQNARAALETADYGYVLELGKVTRSGPAQDLIGDPNLIAAYLGGH